VSASTPLPRRHFIARVLGAWAGSAWLANLFDREPADAATQLDDTPFIGEIRLFAGATPPANWVFCQGQVMQIADNDALYQLIGTTYGGDGVSTFALPDLRGRVPMHVGPGFAQGQLAGTETVTLTTSQLPAHSHGAGADSALGVSDDPTGRVPARNAAGVTAYGPVATADLAAGSVLATGGAAAHNNMQPYLGVNYMISLFGVFPSQS